MRICVVAPGKIDLPLAVQFAWKGHSVIGSDTEAMTVQRVNSAVEPFPGEAELAECRQAVVSRGLPETTDPGRPVGAAIVQADHQQCRNLVHSDLPGASVILDGRHVQAGAGTPVTIGSRGDSRG